jgi:hypothetical protein
MPSKKVISTFIIIAALTFTIIFVSQPKSIVNKSIDKISGSLSSGPEIKTSELNTNWQSDLENITPLSNTAEASSTESLTDSFSRSFMANYLSLKESGTLDSNSAQTLIDKSANFIDPGTQPAYQVKDIVINSDNSRLAITKYGNDLGFAFRINAPKEKKNEVAIFGSMMQTQDKSKVLELQNIAQIYSNTAASLARIVVPSSFASDHLKFINAINNISTAITNMSHGLSDPLKALQGMTAYSQNFEEAARLRSSIGKAILKSGANYKQGEDGYYFFFGI